jgi:SAM-dependent methyltransferase
MLSLAEQNRWREIYRQRRPEWRPATEVYADLVRSYLTAEARLLDLGCGRGGLVEQLVEGNGNVAERPLCEQYSVSSEQYSMSREQRIERWVGVDPDLASLTQHRLPDLPRLAALSDALPFRSASFDLIFCSWLLEHLVRPQQTFAEIGRVLRPGGAFVFITPNAHHPLARLNHALGRVGQIQGWLVTGLYGRSAADAFPTTYQANSPDRLRRLGQANDLHLTDLHAIPDPSYLAFHSLLFRLMCHVEERLPAGRKLHLVGVLQKDGF